MCRRKTRPSIADFPSAVKRTATCMAKKTPSTLKRPRKAVQWISGQTTFTGGRSASLSWATVSYRTTNPSSTHSTAAEAPSVSTKWKSWWALQGEGGYVYVLCLALSRLPAKVMTWGRLNLQLPPHGLITVLFQLRGALFFFQRTFEPTSAWMVNWGGAGLGKSTRLLSSAVSEPMSVLEPNTWECTKSGGSTAEA